MARKTVDIADVVRRINGMIAAPGSTRDGRIALGVLVEALLHESGNYRGFAYLQSEIDDNGALRTNYDDTRRAYIVRTTH